MIAEPLKNLHKKRVVHRDLTFDKISIQMDKRKKPAIAAIKKIKIIGFDLAFCFEKSSYEVTQQFYIEGREFAPEITANQPHGQPADVWGLGQIMAKLLAKTKSQESNSVSRALYKLAEDMVQVDAEARPGVSLVIKILDKLQKCSNLMHMQQKIKS